MATKAAVLDRFAALAAEPGAADGRDLSGLADHLALVMEGVYASVAALGTGGPAAAARGVAATLLDAALR